MATEENDRHGYSQPTLAQYDALKAALDRVRALPLQPLEWPPDVRQNSYSRGWTDAVTAAIAALEG